jgi:hypothetical protein
MRGERELHAPLVVFAAKIEANRAGVSAIVDGFRTCGLERAPNRKFLFRRPVP